MHNSKLRIIISGLLINGALYAGGKSYADVIRNTDTGIDPVSSVNDTYNIDEDMGQRSGANLFHSFDTFNIYQNETANFQAGAGVNNIITRVTGSASTIDGTINSPTNFFLLNTHGIMFGANASLNITGSFHASTADLVKFGENEVLETNAPVNATLYSAPPSAFGFTNSDPAAISVNGATLNNNGYDLSLIGGEINIDQGAQIQSDNATIQLASLGSPGEVSVNEISTLEMDDYAGEGDLGVINISGNSSVDSSGASGGKIVIRGGNLIMNNSSLVSNANGTTADSATESNIDIHISESVELDNWAGIQNSASAEADAGGISITTATLDIANGSLIETSSNTSADAGNININADNFFISGPSSSFSPFIIDYTGLYSVKLAGDSGGGHIHINASQLILENRSAIDTQTRAAYGGNISINGDILRVKSGSRITTSSQENSIGGNIQIDVDNVEISGVHPEPWLAYVFFGEEEMAASNITVFSGTRRGTANGNPGNIKIKSEKLFVLDGAKIQTLSNNSGQSSIIIDSSEILVAGLNEKLYDFWVDTSEKLALSSASSSIRSINASIGSTQPIDSNGKIIIDTGSIKLSENGFISTENRSKAFGSDLSITADHLTLEKGSYISSASESASNNAGNITIETDYISLDNTLAEKKVTGIYAGSSKSAGNTGNIDIKTLDFQLLNGATIASESTNSESGGNIVIEAENSILLSRGSKISASTSGEGNAGNIIINSDLLAVISSDITTTAVLANGGNISINSTTLLMTDDSVISAAAFSNESIDGDVTINAKTELSSASKPTAHIKKSASFVSECNQNNIADNTFNISTKSRIPLNRTNNFLFQKTDLKSPEETTVSLNITPTDTLTDCNS